MYKLAILNTHPIQYFAPLYRRLAQEPDIDLTVYFCSRQGAEEYLDPGFGERIKWDVSLLDGYKNQFLRNLRRLDAVQGFWSLINPGVVSEMRKGRYDALWVNGHNYATYLLAIIAAKILRIPVLMRCETHLQLHRSKLKRAVRQPLMSFLYNQLVTACLPIGECNKQFYKYHGVKEDRLFQVPYAVDNEYFSTQAEQYRDRSGVKCELGLVQDLPVILFASKLIARKRPMDLLAAFHRVRQLGVPAALVFVGSGEEELSLRNYVRENDLKDVHFFGFRNQSELPKFYSIADVFVLPSENEPWGLILNEVMCAALPVLVSREVGASADLVRHYKNGFLFDAGNLKQLADLLLQLLIDPETRARMGERSASIIATWNYEACVQGVRDALAFTQSSQAPLVVNQAA